MKLLVKQNKQPGENTLTYSVLSILAPLNFSSFPVDWPVSNLFLWFSLTSVLRKSINKSFCATLTPLCPERSGYLTAFSRSLLDSLSASLASSLIFGLSKSPFQWNQLSVWEMVSGGLTSSVVAGWWSILSIQWAFDTPVGFPGGDLQTKLVANVMFPPMYMKPYHHVESVTQTHCRSPHYLKCILQITLPCFQSEIPSVQYVGGGRPATLPTSGGPLPFCAMFIPPPLASFATCFQYLSYLMSGHWQTLSIIASSKHPYETSFGKCLTCGFNCIQSIISHRREKLASTPTACSMIENTIHDSLERFAVSNCSGYPIVGPGWNWTEGPSAGHELASPPNRPVIRSRLLTGLEIHLGYFGLVETGPWFHFTVPATLRGIQCLTFDCIVTWSVCRLCKFWSCSTSHCLNCD